MKESCVPFVVFFTQLAFIPIIRTLILKLCSEQNGQRVCYFIITEFDLLFVKKIKRSQELVWLSLNHKRKAMEENNDSNLNYSTRALN